MFGEMEGLSGIHLWCLLVSSFHPPLPRVAFPFPQVQKISTLFPTDKSLERVNMEPWSKEARVRRPQLKLPTDKHLGSFLSLILKGDKSLPQDSLRGP